MLFKNWGCYNVDNDGENESDGDQSKEMEEVGVNKKRKGKAQTKDLEANEGKFCGGPTDSSILYGYKCHLACDVWIGKERGVIRCIQHLAKLDQWKLENECKGFHKKLRETGLHGLVYGVYRHVNPVLACAFFERWHSETNSFHLPFGDMTITLDDVKQIFNLPINGKPVSGELKISNAEAKTLLLEGFGLEKTLIDKVMLGSATQIKLEVLKKHLAEKVKDPKEEGDGKEDNEKGKGKGKKKKKTDEGSSEEEIERAVRGYLLFFFGCTVFCDQSGVAVPVVYLKALMKFKDIKDFAWGAAVLAYIYKNLGVATKAKKRQSTVFMTLLQAWIYEHFPMFSPPPNMNYVNTLPRVMRWANGMSTYLDPLGALKHFRLMMDKMTRHDVIWNPYGNVRDVCPLEDITFYNGGICFFDIDEVYFGERVLRQFGIQQCIPSAPSPSLSSKNKTGKISMGIVTQYWECRDHYIIPVQNRVPLSQTPWDCVDTYLEWYNAISHPYLVNFNPRDPPPYITLYRPPPCDWNAIVNEIGRLLEVGMSSGGGEIPSEKREYFQRALALAQSKY